MSGVSRFARIPALITPSANWKRSAELSAPLHFGNLLQRDMRRNP